MDSNQKNPNRWAWGCVVVFVLLCLPGMICCYGTGVLGGGGNDTPAPSRPQQIPVPVQTEDAEEDPGSNRSYSDNCRIAFLNTYPEKGTYLPSETVLFQGETRSCDNISLAITNDDSGETIHVDGEDNYVADNWTAPNGTADFTVCLYGWDTQDSVKKDCQPITVSGPEAISWNNRTLANGAGDCEGAYEPRMNIAEPDPLDPEKEIPPNGVVTPGEHSTFWSGAGSSDGDRIAYLPAGSEFLVVGNGVCQNGYIWWPVQAVRKEDWKMLMSDIPMDEEIFGYLTEGRPDAGVGRWIIPLD